MSKYRKNLIIIGDWNGHVGTDRLGVENIIGSFGVGERNAEGRRILDFCLTQNLAIMNTFFSTETVISGPGIGTTLGDRGIRDIL